MGCVLGTPARAGVQRRRRREQREVATGEVNNAVRVRDKERHLHTGDFPGTLPALERRKPILDPCAVTQQGWPSWLMAVAGEAIGDWTPRRANTFEKLAKIGQGTYSNVYKARDLVTGKIVALKKVRFDNLEPESVKFMAREILVLRRLDHPNVVKLEGLVTSRMSCSLYLVFEYMEHDLAGLAAGQGVKFTEPQVKCFMKQLLSGLEHCHSRGVLHRDIKGSNLLIDNEGILRIADFGLATFFDPKIKQAMTSRVVTLWYRPPELLLGATLYGVGIDLWSAGCILAELLSGKPIMPGRTEVLLFNLFTGSVL
ncbi:probable serine/threonine-protein kinase At1g54610 isoform X1 [Vigna umbellata]|uniref:probable serine/threonine-protein kinase At1g54610 isoform X1 n=1 Tax=Vigna umbellata TaxID=87088 RepID=UPI001F5E3C89|nr:probable serine/threonine-protein kinase At1g54610 isoform X1 [Vigna umbellata]